MVTNHGDKFKLACINETDIFKLIIIIIIIIIYSSIAPNPYKKAQGASHIRKTNKNTYKSC